MATVKSASSASIFEDSYISGKNYNSAFEKGNIVSFTNARDIKLSIKKDRDFLHLVKSRCEYLDSLKSLRSDWISGSSSAPAIEAVDFSKRILIDFSTWLDARTNLPIPKLIMGPIPTGGIGIEFIVEDKFKLYLNVFNNLSVELTVENTPTERYTEIDTINNSVEYLIKQAYKYFSLY